MRQAPKLKGGGLVAASGLFQYFQCHVCTNFVAVLESVNHSFGHAIYAQTNAVALNRFDPRRIGLHRHLHHFDGWIFHPRHVTAARHGNPNLSRQLGGQLVKLQRRQEAKHGLWHFGCDNGEAFML